MWVSGVAIAIHICTKVREDLGVATVGDHGGNKALQEVTCGRMEVRHHLVRASAPGEIDFVVVNTAQEEVHPPPPWRAWRSR